MTFLARNSRLILFAPELAEFLRVKLVNSRQRATLDAAASSHSFYPGGPLESVRFDPAKDSSSTFPSEQHFHVSSNLKPH